MRNWIQKNLKTIIVTAFVIPILLVAFVSISHVTLFYGISNPMAWAIYLSVAVEIAAISALAGVSVKLGKFIYFPFILVTFIQFVGNLFFSFSYIQESSDLFKQWLEMSGPLFEPMGVESTDIPKHKLILALFSGGLLPFISLTFAHMLVVYSNSNKDTVKLKDELTEEQINELSRKAGVIEREINSTKPPIGLTPENLEKLAEHLDKVNKNKFNTDIDNGDEETIKNPTQGVIEDDIIVENQTLEEFKDKLAENSGIKRLTYTKTNA
jgi:hypothetical protein